MTFFHTLSTNDSAYFVAAQNSLCGNTSTLPQDIASRNLGEGYIFTILNNSERKVHINWIDHNGQLGPHTSLTTGETYRKYSFTGHTWTALDDDNIIVPLNGQCYFRNNATVLEYVASFSI